MEKKRMQACEASFHKEWRKAHSFTLKKAQDRESQTMAYRGSDTMSHTYLFNEKCWYCSIALLRWFLYIQEYKTWPLWDK